MRPIVFGSKGLGRLGTFLDDPELVFSVHGRADRLLGYVVVDRTRADSAAWGGMTIGSDACLDSALASARSTTLQLLLFGVRRGSHHCLLLCPPETQQREAASLRREFTTALRPLVDADVCSIVFTRGDDGVEPQLARQGLTASVTASALAALEFLQLDPAGASVAVHPPTPWARRLADKLADYGLRLEADGDDSLAMRADVLLVASPLWSVGAGESNALRARTVIALGATKVDQAAERRLHERGIVLVPDALSTAGLILATDLRARGLDAKTALRRTFTVVEERTRSLLADARETSMPLTAVFRASLGPGQAEQATATSV